VTGFEYLAPEVVDKALVLGQLGSVLARRAAWSEFARTGTWAIVAECTATQRTAAAMS